MGLPVAEGTPRTWEAGRSPSPENIEGLERIFGTVAPETGRSADATPADLSLLLGALLRQTEAITELVSELRASRADVEELREEMTGLREGLADLAALRSAKPSSDHASAPPRGAVQS